MILEEIVQQKRREIAQMADIAMEDLTPSSRDFLSTLQQDKLTIIAEIKAKSPSHGVIKKNMCPATIAKQYTAGGADAISVLTDQPYFGGHFDYLKTAHQHTHLPLLCKDFILDRKQVKYARLMQADACLLIVGILSDTELATLKNAIESLGMTALLEVYNETELKRAISLDPEVMMINNRDLTQFTIHSTNSQQLCQHIPNSIPVISASGITRPEAIRQLPAQIKGVLIGTALMTSSQPEQFLQALRDYHEN